MRARDALVAPAVLVAGQPGIWRVAEVTRPYRGDGWLSWLLEPADAVSRSSLRPGARMRRVELPESGIRKV